MFFDFYGQIFLVLFFLGYILFLLIVKPFTLFIRSFATRFVLKNSFSIDPILKSTVNFFFSERKLEREKNWDLFLTTALVYKVNKYIPVRPPNKKKAEVLIEKPKDKKELLDTKKWKKIRTQYVELRLFFNFFVFFFKKRKIDYFIFILFLFICDWDDFFVYLEEENSLDD